MSLELAFFAWNVKLPKYILVNSIPKKPCICKMILFAMLTNLCEHVGKQKKIQYGESTT